MAMTPMEYDDGWQDISSSYATGISSYYARKKGRIVVFSCYITNITIAANADIQISLLTSNTPVSYTAVAIAQGVDGAPQITGVLGNNGILYLRNITAVSGKPYFVSGTYITSS